MKFSIIIPVYNNEKYIAECTKSLLSLEYPDKEIIIVNDGSTDCTAQILKKFAARKLKIINLKQRSGIICASNRGLSVASGDIIIRTDGDTIVNKDWLNRFSSYFRDKDIMAVGGSYKCLNDSSIVALCTSTIDAIFVNLLRRKLLFNRLPGANRAMRKDAFLSVNGFGQGIDFSEDIGTYLKLKSLGKIVFDPEIIVATHYPENLQQLWKRHYFNGYGIASCLKSPKAWIRPILMLGFYLTIMTAFMNVFLFTEIRLLSGISMMFYSSIFIAIAILSLFALHKKRFLFLIVPLIFIIQNTAYLCGIARTLLSKRLKR